MIYLEQAPCIYHSRLVKSRRSHFLFARFQRGEAGGRAAAGATLKKTAEAAPTKAGRAAGALPVTAAAAEGGGAGASIGASTKTKQAAVPVVLLLLLLFVLQLFQAMMRFRRRRPVH